MKRLIAVVVLFSAGAIGIETDLYAQSRQVMLRDSLLTTGQQFRRKFRSVTDGMAQSVVTFHHGDEVKPVAMGTIVEADGKILTKATQVQSADRCHLPDGTIVKYEVVGLYEPLDLALVSVEQSDLKPVTWTTEDPKVGQWIVTPSDHSDPAGVGVLSVSRREIPRSNVHGVLGIELEQTSIATIRRVFPNSGALAAGLKTGDVIVRLNEVDIENGRQLVSRLRTFRPGEKVALLTKRGEEEQSFSITLTHPFGDFLSRIATQNQMGGSLSFRRDEFAAVYQHDTVLTPEQCGGPVLNLDGKVIGLNIARAGRTESYALPTDVITPVLKEMLDGKHAPVSEDKSNRPPTPPIPVGL